jgi:hypothetical protein
LPCLFTKCLFLYFSPPEIQDMDNIEKQKRKAIQLGLRQKAQQEFEQNLPMKPAVFPAVFAYLNNTAATTDVAIHSCLRLSSRRNAMYRIKMLY